MRRVVQPLTLRPPWVRRAADSDPYGVLLPACEGVVARRLVGLHI